MSAKMGRPLSDNPRKYVVGCKLTADELERLNAYCIKKKMKKSSVIKSAIEPIINPVKKESE